jgi:hypothetical protein
MAVVQVQSVSPGDILVLGGIAFTNYSPPEYMMAGGKQAMVVHKLPGGARVIDTLGPDEADITWQGFFFGNDAYSNVLLLDSMRAAGNVIGLSWGGEATRQVIISEFIYHIRRLPVWVEYNITCTVYENPALGDLAVVIANQTDTQINSDLQALENVANGYNPDGSLIGQDMQGTLP